MSLLTKTLERIFIYLQNNYPEIASSLQPGLSYAEIEAKLSSLPFCLPQEFYQLYQWKNGTLETSNTVEFYKYYRFLPLEEALTMFPREGEDSWIVDEVFPYAWFPIFTFEGDEHCGVVGSQIQKCASPIIRIFHSEDVTHTSLTSMMQEIAECYTTGIYYLDEYNHIAAKSEAENKIRLKYNPEIIIPSSPENYRRETIKKSASLKIINTYNLGDRLVNTRIIDKQKNLDKSLDYLGGKIIRVYTSKIKHKSIADSYFKQERFYSDHDIFERQIIVRKKGWLRREKTYINRRYINGVLKQETITTK